MPVTSWPWPRIFVTEHGAYVVSETSGTLIFSTASFSPTMGWLTVPVLNLGNATVIDSISIADFGMFFIVCTLGIDALGHTYRQMFVRNIQVPLNLGSPAFVTDYPVICGIGMNYKGQFVGANSFGTNITTDTNIAARTYVWSAIGKFTLLPLESSEPGYGVLSVNPIMHAQPQVFALKQLGNSIVAYSNFGRTELRSTSVQNFVVLGERPLSGLGIVSGNHVAGDETVHGWIDLNREFWTAHANGQHTRRGYREFIEPIVTYTNGGDTRTIVSFIPHEETFYISNGNTCLVINQYGAATIDQMVSSVVQAPNGTLHGTYVAGSDDEMRIKLDRQVFGSQGWKSIENMLVGISHDGTATIDMSTEFRMSNGGNYADLGWRYGGPRSSSRIGVTALDFMPKVRVTDGVTADVELFNLLVNIKYSDQRWKRGTVPAQYEVGSA